MSERLRNLLATGWIMWFSGLTLGACGSIQPVEEDPEPVTITVFSGRASVQVEPTLGLIPSDASFRVRVEYGSDHELSARLTSEPAASGVDVILVEQEGHLDELSARGVLDTLPVDIHTSVDPRFRDRAGRWVGTSGELRVLAYRKAALTPEDLPKKLYGLSRNKWNGRVGWAPLESGFLDHVTGLRKLWGDEKTGAWLTAVSGHVPLLFADDAAVVQALDDGTIDVGWVGHTAIQETGEHDDTVAQWSFSKNHDPGNTMLVSGVGIIEGTPHLDAAQDFVRWLGAETTQVQIGLGTFRYPTRLEVPPHPLVPPLSDEQLTGHHAKNLIGSAQTEVFLRQLGVL